MKNFARAIRDSAHHWPMLVAATLCSFGIATLWGANIGALYPVIEMTLKGESAQSRLQHSIDASLTRIDELNADIKKREAEPAAAQADNNVATAEQKKQADQAEIASEEQKISWNRRLLGFADRYLPRDPFQTICLIMGVLVISTLVKHILMLTNDLLIGYVSTSIVRSMRTRVFNQALGLDRKTYQGYGTSGVLATITHTSDMLSNGLMNFFGAAIREPLRVVACLIGAGLICWRLLFLSLVLAPLLIFTVYWFNRKVKAIARALLGRNTGFHEVILEALNNIFTVQAYTMEHEEKARFAHCTKDMQRCGMRMIFYTGMSKPFTELIGVGMIAITVCAGAYLVVNKQTHLFFLKISDEPLTVSSLLIFFGMLIGASDPLRKLSGVAAAIHGGTMAADALYQLLDQPQVLREPEHPATLATPHSSLTIEDLSFSYLPENPVLSNVSLTIPYGKTVAIVGGNGSGKSTLIQLLCRFYDPVQGKITINGTDYRDISLHDLRKRIALVSQQTELFNRSVMDNILYGSPNCTRDEAIAAAKLAHAHDFITSSLENGYDTIVGQGGQRLSGGQRQRIAMARAILRKPEILILDESTSQIDMSSELQIRQSLAELKGSCTIIIITHREALLALADETYEVRAGRVSSSDFGLQASA